MSFSDNIEQFEHEIVSSDSEFEKHSKYDFEVTLNYKIDYTQDKNIFMLEMFGFVPKSLQINENTYTSTSFFNDLNLYTRYKTPKISLKTLLNPKVTYSPLNRIDEYLKDPEGTKSKILYETRLLGAISRVNIRNQLEKYSQIIKSGQTIKIESYTKFLTRLNSLMEKIIQLYDKIDKQKLPSQIKDSFSYVAQFIFIQIELRISKFLWKVDMKIPDDLKNPSIQLILDARKEILQFNPQAGLILHEPGEIFDHSEGILKKFSQRVLYLDHVRKKKESRAKQLAYSIAAGVAMVLSILLTILVISQFQENSLPFVVGIVVIYMFKDRIKYFIQWLSKKTIRIFLPDRTHKIRDPYENTYIGVMRETMRFLDEDEIPQKVVEIRNLERSPVENQENLETVFKYKKIMQLQSKTISKIHDRVKNLHDIIRFNIRSFIRYADDPYKIYPTITGYDSKETKSITQFKVYHLNLIFRISRLKSKKDKASYYQKVRVVLDQNGIKRLEYPKI